MDDKRNEIKSTIMNRIQMINNEMNKKSSQQSKNDNNIQNRRWNYANTNAIRTLERQQQKQQKSSQIIESSISNEPNKKMSTINSDSLKNNDNDYDDDVGDHNNRKEIIDNNSECHQEISNEPIEEISPSSSSSSSFSLKDGENNDNSGSSEIIMKNVLLPNNDENTDSSSTSSPAFYTITKPTMLTNFSFDSSATTMNTNLRPILKRKDSLDKSTVSKNPPDPNLPPPILKKRDSSALNIDGNIISSTGNDSSSSTLTSSMNSNNDVATLCLQQPPPPSILKNRQQQPRGSYSFDETLNINTDVIGSTSDDPLQPHYHQQQPYHLKPILKKKSWSTESGPDHFGHSTIGSNSNNDHQVKGILKSSSIDRSPPQQSSPTGSSLLTATKNSSNFDERDPGTTVSYLYSHSTTNEQSTTTTSFSSNKFFSPSNNLSTAGLKSILKSSSSSTVASRQNRLRSTSLSPTASTDSLSLLSSNTDESEESSSSLVINNNRKSAFRKRASLDGNLIVNSIGGNDESSSKPLFRLFNKNKNDEISVINQATIQSSSSSSSMATETIIKPILKSNLRSDNSGNNCQNQQHQCLNDNESVQSTCLDSNDIDDNSMSSSSSSSSLAATSLMEMIHTLPDNNDINNDNNNEQSSSTMRIMSTTASSSPTTATATTSMDTVIALRFQASPTSSSRINSSNINNKIVRKVRPKSCFVIGVADDNHNNDGNIDDDGGGSTTISISERLAKLKQNGEYGWRQRIIPRDQQQQSSSSSTTTTKSMLKSTNSLKSDTKEIKIANRLSALMDSQSQWRARVPEKDAKKFTVASKLSTTNTNNTPTNDKSNDNDGMDKVVLRETPKRHGLRGSTLSEKKLGAISLKLNTVLGKDKNPFSSPSQRSPISKTKSNNNDDGNGNNNQTSSLEQSTNATNKISQPETIMILKPDDEESFGSFFGFDSNRMNELLKPSSPALSTTTPLDNDKEQQSYSLSTLDTTTSTIKLLSESKKTRVQAPRRRRQATGKNPLARASIAIDSYQTSSSTTISSSGVTNGTIHMDDDSKISSSSPISSTPRTPSTPITKDDSRFALSALAGLASVEDFKSVANKLRSNNSVVRNDSWRTFDLKNSLQSKMLILIKGRRKAHTRLIEPRWQSLNQMDSFILVTKDKIIAYIGRYSNIIERTKCMEISDLIRKRKDLCFRSSSNGVTLIDCQNDLNLSNNSILMDRLMPLLQELNFIIENDVDQFEKSIGLTILNLDLDEDDEFYEEFINHSNIVYQVLFDEKSDAEKAELRPLENNCGRQPRHAILQQDKALVFDFGSEMYIWLGKSVSNVIRKKAVEAAKDYWYQGYDYSEFDCCPLGNNITIKSDRRPDWAWFIRVNQNMEPILFKDKFFNWPAFTLTRPEKKYQSRKSSLSSSTTITNNDDAKKHKCCKKDLSAELNLFPVDVEKDMIQNVPQQQELILECVSLGRGAGDTIHDEDGLPVKVITLDVQCFVIDECGDRVELNEMDKNFLCSSESYYIRWKYRLTRISRCLKTGGESRYSVEQHGGRDRVCYFVWQGKDTRNTQRGITALNAIEKLRVEGASQTYVEHGQEDPIFLRIFQGSLVIQNGKRKQTNNCGSYRMFMLKDTLPEEQFMIELECSFRNLRSRISYAFVNPGHSSKIYLWHGCKTNESERLKIRTFFDTNILKHRSQEFGFPVDDLIDDYHLIDLDEGRESREFMNIFQQQQQILSPDSTLTRRQSKSNLHRDVYFSLIDDNRHYCFTPRLFHFRTSSDRIFESIEIISSYYPPKSARATIHISYPFVQDDIYGRAKTRPTFFLFDAEYEVYLWESKYPFFISSNQTTMKNEHQQNQNKSPVDDDDDDGGGDERRQQMPKMIDIEEEIQSECNMTTGFAAQLWLAERKCALETTLAYCHAKNPAEPPKSYVISAGLEPDSFCGLFPTWTYYDNVAKLHIQDGRKPGEQILVQEVLSQMEDINQSTYSYEELKRRPLPEGINILCLESYLDDEEFEKVFSMNREEFCSLPTWKQKLIKQEKELF